MLHAALVAFAALIAASTATFRSPGSVEYTLRVDAADLSTVSVDMRIRAAPAGFAVAMATHAEYDDQYWRYLTDMTGTSARGAVTVTREDSSVWHVTGPAGDVTISYRVHYPLSPPAQQGSWKAHLTPNGGLIGGPHSFLYLVGGEHHAVRVTLALPRGWSVATGLTPAGNPGEFTAPGAEVLIDSPMLVGELRTWPFTINGVPHHLAYLGHPGGASFDSVRFVSDVERMARETVKMFGAMPYREYQFLFEDGTSGGLEHVNSVSIGARSADLAREPNSYLGQIAHEYFHTWNEVHLRPATWIGLRHVSPEPTGELWWAEGVTLYYADLMLRRAGLHTTDSTRLAHLERLVTAYLANPSHGMVSLEHVSREFNLPTGGNGDFTPSMYTQGEVVGLALDLMIRDSSNGARSLDDAMRDLTRRFTPAQGYTGADIEHAVSAACGCDVQAFFDRYVRRAGAVDFDAALAVLGLRTAVTWEPARNADGALWPDLRVSGYVSAGERTPRLQIWFPATVWARAGLHTGDRVVSWNGAPVADPQQLRSAIGKLRVGDTARIVVSRTGGDITVPVVVTGYDRPIVRIEDLPGATAAQRARRAKWVAGR